jgi:hypothetical protein
MTVFITAALSDRKASPMSWSKRILITLALAAGLLLLPVIYLVFWDIREAARLAQFERTHPMLAKMAASFNERNEILLARLPIGSPRTEALNTLSEEGMSCERPRAIAQRDMLLCWTTYPRGTWHIEVRFDANDKVAGGRVLLTGNSL